VLSRRYSGGGTIYQDKQCTQFTFVDQAENFDLNRNFSLIVASLKDLGVAVEVSGRNDIVTTESNHKISGSAFKFMPPNEKRSGVSLHHGTLLIDTDMAALGRYLTPNKLKLQSKGISSVASRVINLKEINSSLDHDVVCSALEKRFLEYYNMPPQEPEILSRESTLLNAADFLELHDKISDWNFRFGTTPEFSHNVETRIEGVGMFDVHCQVTNAKVEKIVIFSDALYPETVDEIRHAMLGATYTPRAIHTALGTLEVQGPRKVLVDSFAAWFTSAMES